MADQLKRYLLGEFELETEKRLLTSRRPIGSSGKQAVSGFLYLIENRERLVGRKELFECFWQGSDVYDWDLNAVRLARFANHLMIIWTVLVSSRLGGQPGIATLAHSWSS